MCALINRCIVIFCLFISCTNANRQQPAASSSLISKSIWLRKVGELLSRRSFANIQFMNDPAERGLYIQEQEKANPSFIYPTDSGLIKRFQSLGLVNEHEILLSRFTFDTSSSSFLVNSDGKKIHLRFDFAPIRSNDNKLTASFASDTTQLTIPGFSERLKYTLVDVVPGGNKEILVLNEYYVMNGYNFDLYVYEVNTGKEKK